MCTEKLQVGRIDYLNIWPLFYSINKNNLNENISFVSGHPAQLNAKLASKEIHVSPSSSIEYLSRAERYRLLPDLGISASGNVQSVLFCLPFPWGKLREYVESGGEILLTGASDTSRGLLQVLWKFYWQLPPPVWKNLKPGQGLKTGRPFLEIGDHALRLNFRAPAGWHIVDLAMEWKKMTSLPFVFALWIINRDLSMQQKVILHRLTEKLIQAKQTMHENYSRLSSRYPANDFSQEHIVSYWERMDYGLGPEHLAGLTVFGEYLTRLDIIQGMPALDFFK